MCKEILTPLLSGFFAAGISSFMANRNRKKQNQYQDTQNRLPILIEVLDDLEVLIQAFQQRGVYVPLIEHRCPVLSEHDGDGLSYARRGHQFRLIGYRIIRNCRKMIYLTPKRHLPQVLEVCAAIMSFLQSKKPDSKTHLDYIIDSLVLFLGMKKFENNTNVKEFKEFVDQLSKFHENLEKRIQEELPYLAEK